MTLFQYLIEFSKLTDIEKKYLSEMEWCLKQNVRRSDLNEVEKSLIEKGWLYHRGEVYPPRNSYSLDISYDYKKLFDPELYNG